MSMTQTMSKTDSLFHCSRKNHLTRLLYLITFQFLTKLVSVYSTDLRIISYEDLHLDGSTKLFERAGLTHYDRALLDETNNHIVVGIRDHLLKLRLSDLRPLEVTRWSSDNNTVALCLAKGQKQEDCHNYIRVLLQKNGTLFACGTNSYSPSCSSRKLDWMHEVLSWTPGSGKCPYGPRHNHTYLLTKERDFYSAIYTDFTDRDPAIYRSMGPSRSLRTVQYNSKWLNEPDFVATYEINDFIYFFFRETAIEHISCGKAVFSRIARICKNDDGGKVVLEDNWTTFAKARLNCSRAGEFPFYFDYIEAVSYSAASQTFYAVFTTSSTSVYASAVCEFRLSAVEQAFSGAYKHQEDGRGPWVKSTTLNPAPKCEEIYERAELTSDRTGYNRSSHRRRHNSKLLQRHLVDVQKYQLMYEAVQQTSLNPLLVAEIQRYTKLVLDTVSVGYRGRSYTTRVLFLATLEGAIHKYVILPSSDETCLVEIIQLVAPDRPQSIRTLQLIKSQLSLLVGTRDRLYVIPVQRCKRFTGRSQCLHAQDPYCDWSEEKKSCVPSGHPHLTSCPQSQHYSVDGGWSNWSQWERCSSGIDNSHSSGAADTNRYSVVQLSQQEHSMNTGEQEENCMCRSRACDNPRVIGTGLACQGSNMQVINCTRHGGWSRWNDWSACSQSCVSQSFRTRSRHCGNPAPQHGGNPCSGDKSQTEKCHVPDCTNTVSLDITGQWSGWENWSECSVKCGYGYKTRRRKCLYEGKVTVSGQCEGSDTEMTVCKKTDCKLDREVQYSDWTQWIRVSSFHESGKEKFKKYREMRSRCECSRSSCPSNTATSTENSARLNTEVRFCSAKNGCYDTKSDSELYKKFSSLPENVTIVPEEALAVLSNGNSSRISEEEEYIFLNSIIPNKIDRKLDDIGIDNCINCDANNKKFKYSYDKNLLANRISKDKKSAKQNKSSPEIRKAARKLWRQQRSFCGCRDLGQLTICKRCVKQFPNEQIHKTVT